MDVRPNARSGLASERTTNMADPRKCIGSARFGIEPHDAPVEDFPKQPSQKDGLGRMCKTHWNQYTAGLARDTARKAAAEAAAPSEAAPTTDAVTVESEASAAEPSPKRSRRATKSAPAADGQEAAG